VNSYLLHYSTFFHCEEIPKINQFKTRKDLFWLTVSEALVHSGLTMLLLAL
jgi:hypothetical protein